MTQEEISKLSDEELLIEAKKMKKVATLNALLIGVMFGIIFYSVVKSTLGFFTLIPLFFIYKIANKPNNNKALKDRLKERGLK